MAVNKKAVAAEGEEKVRGVQSQAKKFEFTKKQILASVKYGNRRDLIDALLEQGKSYTMEEVENLMDNFMKGKVK